MTIVANLILLALTQQQAPDPYLLDIGRPGQTRVEQGLTNLHSGAQATVDDVAAAADGLRFVLVGESHTSASHHKLQAEIIEALVKRGRSVIVGFEMFTRPIQPNLAPWSMGLWDEPTFLERANWQGQWGFDFAIYRPIFAAVREHKLPMVALNIPRDWVRTVGRGGPDALTAKQKAELPNLYLGNAGHKRVFGALLGGHPPMGQSGDNMYAAQVLWDEGMADTALKYFDLKRRTSNAVMVIVAGSGHVMYNQGINWRIERRTGERTLSVVAIDSDTPRAVSNGIADFVFVGTPEKGG